MRKTLGIMMAAAIMGSMTGCSSQPTSQTTAAVETTLEEVTEAPATDKDMEETNDAAGDTQTGEAEGGADSEGGQESGNVDGKLSEIHKAVQDAYKDGYIPSAPYDGKAMKSIFGVDESLYDSFLAEGPMISVNVETFVGVAAKEGKGEEVEKALNQYRDSLIADTMQYPMNIVKIQASQVVRHGDYVFFIMLGAPSMESEENGEEAALLSAQENNKIGIDVIDGFFK